MQVATCVQLHCLRCFKLVLGVLGNEGDKVGHLSVDSGVGSLSAAVAPGDNADEDVIRGVIQGAVVINEGAARVTLSVSHRLLGRRGND